MKKFMKMCGIDFLVFLVFFFLCVYFWFDYHLDVFFDAKSAVFGASYALTCYFLVGALDGLLKWIKYRKSSAVADDNN